MGISNTNGRVNWIPPWGVLGQEEGMAQGIVTMKKTPHHTWLVCLQWVQSIAKYVVLLQSDLVSMPFICTLCMKAYWGGKLFNPHSVSPGSQPVLWCCCGLLHDYQLHPYSETIRNHDADMLFSPASSRWTLLSYSFQVMSDAVALHELGMFAEPTFIQYHSGLNLRQHRSCPRWHFLMASKHIDSRKSQPSMDCGIAANQQG